MKYPAKVVRMAAAMLLRAHRRAGTRIRTVCLGRDVELEHPRGKHYWLSTDNGRYAGAVIVCDDGLFWRSHGGRPVILANWISKAARSVCGRDVLFIEEMHAGGGCRVRWYFDAISAASYAECASLDHAREMAKRLDLSGILL